jgi:maleate cis-trans isomerase
VLPCTTAFDILAPISIRLIIVLTPFIDFIKKGEKAYKIN